MDDIRTKKQKLFAQMWLDSNRFNILYLSPRFGKIFTTVNILEGLLPNLKLLIAYPDKKIKKSWEEDFKKRKYNPNVTYTTHLSLKKQKEELFDLIIIDEIHLLSAAQRTVCKEMFKRNKQVLGLTGTLSNSTANVLRDYLKLIPLVTYTIDDAVNDGILPDYEITVVKTKLDNTLLKTFGKKIRTEKSQYSALTWVIKKLRSERKNSMFMELKRVRLIQGSEAKIRLTQRLIDRHFKERLLIFCGLTEMADRLNIPTYHSKSEDDSTFDDFVTGKIPHLAVIKIGNSGVTYLPLNRVIISSFDSNSENLAQRINRAMSIEYDNPDKKAKIYIVCSTEKDEIGWLYNALEFFNKEKIKWINT